MAYYREEGYLCFCEQQPHCLGLDNLGGSFLSDSGVGIELLADQMSLAIEPSSSESSDRSTGYLEDAVVEWSERCKRRRTLQFEGEQAVAFPTGIESVENILQEELWNWNNAHEDPAEDLSSLSDPSSNNPGVHFGCTVSSYNGSLTVETTSAAEPGPVSSSATSSAIENPTAAIEAATTAAGTIQSSKPMCLATSTQSLDHFLLKGIHDKQKKRKKKKLVMRGVLCPFTVIKPAGVDGSLTLDDINQRLLRRPTRPVRHPVGKFACLPCVTTVAGPGLSGKAVVGLTRVHTQGRGTITIIRTKG